MDEKVITISKEILNLEEFNLYMFHNYITEYGKDTIIKVFSYILNSNKNSEEIFYKYFDAFFSIELDVIKLNQNSYTILVKKYGEERINNYFMNLLEIYEDDEKIKNKYNLIYKHLRIGEQEYFSEDSVKIYMNSIKDKVLSNVEEKECFYVMDKCRKNIKIATFNEIDSIVFENFDKVICSISSSNQLKLLNKIKDFMSISDKNKFNEVYPVLKNYFKTNKLLIIENSKVYDDIFFDEQLLDLFSFFEARQLLIQSNLKLVISIAKNFKGYNLNILDFIQEGNIGLMRAIKKFDVNLGYRLSTYATHWIKQAIQRSIAEQARVVRIPVHTEEKIQKVNTAIRNLEAKYGYSPSDEEIANYLNFSVDDVIFVKKSIYNSTVISLNTNVGEDGDATIEEFVDSNNPDSFDMVAYKHLQQVCVEALNTLTEKEKFVIMNRFGFDGNRTKTLEDVGKMMGVTRERIRQIENKALRKLKHPTRRKLFDGYY